MKKHHPKELDRETPGIFQEGRKRSPGFSLLPKAKREAGQNKKADKYLIYKVDCNLVFRMIQEDRQLLWERATDRAVWRRQITEIVPKNCGLNPHCRHSLEGWDARSAYLLHHFCDEPKRAAKAVGNGLVKESFKKTNNFHYLHSCKSQCFTRRNSLAHFVALGRPFL